MFNRMKHCLVFASLISPSKMSQFQLSSRCSSGDETLHLMFDILHEQGIY